MVISSKITGLCCQVLLVILVVGFGCANNITKQIAAVPLERFTYMMGLVTAVVYVVAYWAIYLVLIVSGCVIEPQKQLGWMFLGGGPCFGFTFAMVTCAMIIYSILLLFFHQSAGWVATVIGVFILCWVCFCGCKGPWSEQPGLKIIAVAAIGDALGDSFGYICTPYVSGPVHTLLAQSTTVFVALLSVCALQKRYSFLQCTSLLAVILVAVAGVLPNLSKKSSNGKSTQPLFATLLSLTCIFNAIAFLAKEYAFSSFASWAKRGSRLLYSREECEVDDSGSMLCCDSDEEDDGEKVSSLNVFTVNTTESSLQLPLTLLVMPLARATGQTHGNDLHTYLVNGFKCMGGTSMDPSHSCDGAGYWMMWYIGCNLCFNIVVLLSVKLNSALATFVAMKAITPTSALLFAVIDWPELGRTPVSTITWVVFALLIPAIAIFYWSSSTQDARHAEDPKLATCCWPFFRGKADQSSIFCTDTDDETSALVDSLDDSDTEETE